MTTIKYGVHGSGGITCRRVTCPGDVDHFHVGVTRLCVVLNSTSTMNRQLYRTNIPRVQHLLSLMPFRG